MRLSDPNRRHWEAIAREEESDWELLATEPLGIEEERGDDPAGIWLRPLNPLVGAPSAGHSRRRVHQRIGSDAPEDVRPPGERCWGDDVHDRVWPRPRSRVPESDRDGQQRVSLAARPRREACCHGWRLMRRGAALALAVALRARDSGVTAPVALLLLSAWVDLEAVGDSYDSRSDPFFTREVVRSLGEGYLAGGDPRDPLASALYADCRDRMAVADDAIGRAGAWLRSKLSS